MHIFSFFIGFLLITVAPYAHGLLTGWTVQIGGSYGLSILEAFFLATTYFSVVHYGLVRRDLPVAKEARVFFFANFNYIKQGDFSILLRVFYFSSDFKPFTISDKEIKRGTV